MTHKEIPAAVSAEIREQEQPTPNFRSDFVDVLFNGRRVDVISQAEALRGLDAGEYEAVGNGTVKYVRLVGAEPTKRKVYSWNGARRGAGFTKPGRFRS